MSEAFSRYKLSQRVVRLIVVANLILLALDLPSPTFYRLLEQFHLNTAVVMWFIASSLILPLYVLIELFWMKKLLKGRSIVIDAALVATWFIAWWVSALYSLVHTVWL